jgi:hypothetical protein
MVVIKELANRVWSRGPRKVYATEGGYVFSDGSGLVTKELDSSQRPIYDPVYESVAEWLDEEGEELRYHFLLFDFDNSVEVEYARMDTINFCRMLNLSYEVSLDLLPIFFSGQKGFHVLLPAGAWAVGDWYDTNKNNIKPIKLFADILAGGFSSWDKSIYDARRVMRIAGTAHTETGLFKTPLRFDELATMSVEQIKERASKQPTEEAHLEWYGTTPLRELFIQCEVLSQEVDKRAIVSGTGSPFRDYFHPAKKGDRNASATRLAGLLRKADIELGLAQMIVATWNKTNAEPLDQEELSRLVHKIFKRY